MSALEVPQIERTGLPSQSFPEIIPTFPKMDSSNVSLAIPSTLNSLRHLSVEASISRAAATSPGLTLNQAYDPLI